MDTTAVRVETSQRLFLEETVCEARLEDREARGCYVCPSDPAFRMDRLLSRRNEMGEADRQLHLPRTPVSGHDISSRSTRKQALRTPNTSLNAPLYAPMICIWTSCRLRR